MKGIIIKGITDKGIGVLKNQIISGFKGTNKATLKLFFNTNYDNVLNEYSMIIKNKSLANAIKFIDFKNNIVNSFNNENLVYNVDYMIYEVL